IRRACRNRRAAARRRARDGRLPATRLPRAGEASAWLGAQRMETANVVVRTRVNGVWREADVWPGTSLLVFLREALGLYGSKNACEQGECGSCSVWLDGTLACSCLVLRSEERRVGKECRSRW